MTLTVRLIFLFPTFFLYFFVNAQNLVPNPSFEELRDLPVKPNPRNSFRYEPKSGYIPYQKNLNYWFAATETTPDLRISNHEKDRECKRKFKVCDKARTGMNCVGIITYMSNTTTDTYREYVQIKLKKRLRPNVKTFVEFWVSKEREAKLVSNNLGCHFSMRKTVENTLETLDLIPQVNYDSVINETQKEWIKIERTFVPDMPFVYLLIGNFYKNDQTKALEFKQYNGSPYTPFYAYYLIDDVRVWQEGDKEVLVFKEKEVIKDETVQLKNIEFEFDSATLKAASFEEINQLLDFLKKYPTVKIAIQGHTDNQGSDAYNQRLSAARAKTVYLYLIENGVSEQRLSHAGFGEKNPLTDNTTKDGRSKNRRVEFLVVEKNE